MDAVAQHSQLNVILDGYEKIYQAEFLRLYRSKLGLGDRRGGTEQP